MLVWTTLLSASATTAHGQQPCPQPLDQTLCTPLQSVACKGGAPGEFCRPHQVRIASDIIGLPLVIAEQCDCFDEVGCGPLQVTPDPISNEIHLSCAGECPIKSQCRVFLDGVFTDDTQVEASELVLGTVVTCGCPAITPLCDLPTIGAPDPCAELQPFDCQNPEGTGFCLPIEVAFDPAGGTVTVLECACADLATDCRIVLEPGAAPTCGGPCAEGHACLETVTDAPGGPELILRCECEPFGACCLDADGDGLIDDCGLGSSLECAQANGSFQGAGAECGLTGACCYDADGDGAADTCQNMPDGCCPGACRGAACAGDGNGDGVDDQCTCPADLARNGVVNAADLAQLLGQWGPCAGACSADLTCDGVVDANDLPLLLGAWGACP